MAQLAVAAAGAAVGSLVGAPQAGWLVGSVVGGLLFAGKQRVEGPRLGDLQVQASTYGADIPQVFGSMRLAGNVIWARPLIERRRSQSAGKGGGGQTVVSYEYFATFAVALARGPVDAIRRVWADGKLLVDLSEDAAQQGPSFRYGERIYHLHLGTEDQAPDPVIEMHEGAGNAPAYRGLAYLTFDELPLRDLGNRIPNITAEVVATASTVHPAQPLDLPAQGVESWGKAGWLLDPGRPYLYNALGSRLTKLNRASGAVVDGVDVSQLPEIVRWWAEHGWPGGPGVFGYAVDAVSGDLFVAFNGLSRTTFARLDPDTLALRAWYRQGLFAPGPMLVVAGRYLAAQSSLNGPVVVVDFGAPSGPPAELASVPYASRGQGLALDPERARLYVLTKSATGAEGWVSWIDAGYTRHGPWHLEADLGFPAGSAPSGITHDRASGRVIVGCSTGLFACDPETLAIEQSLLGGYVGGGFVDYWENQPAIDGELWVADGNTVRRLDTVALAEVASWNVQALHGVGLEAAVHDPLTGALWTSSGGVRKLWFDRRGHGSVTLGAIVSALCGRAGLDAADLIHTAPRFAT